MVDFQQDVAHGGDSQSGQAGAKFEIRSTKLETNSKNQMPSARIDHVPHPVASMLNARIVTRMHKPE